MSVHRCSLPRSDSSGLHKLPPNASLCKRLLRRFHKLTLLDPDNFRCKAFYHHKSAILIDQRKHVRGRYRYMIHPFSTLNMLLEATICVIWVSKMIICSMMDNMLKEVRVMRAIVTYILSSMQIAMIICTFFIGYIDKEGNEVILKQSSVAKRYLSSYFFFDVVTTEVFDPLFRMCLDKYMPATTIQWQMKFLSRIIEVPCLYVRLYSILDYVSNTGELLGIPLKIRKCTNYLLKTYLYLHLFCCILYWVPQMIYHDDFPLNSWLVVAKINPLSNPTLFKVYGECMLLTVCFFFGASAGKYRISETNEQVCLSFISLFGRLYTLFLLADLLRFFGIVGLSEANYDKQMLQLREYMMSNGIPKSLRTRMVRYYEKKLQKRHFKETDLLNSLSDRLRAELFLHSAQMLMQKSDLFKHLPQFEIATIVSMMRLETFAPGDVIFEPGQNVETVFFISFGSVAILNRSGTELCHMEDGEVFGLCLTMLKKRNYFALVVETSELFLINVAELDEFLKAYPQASHYMKCLAVERFAFYRQMEQNINSHMDSCLEELKKGVLLEKKRRRKVVRE
ncbi:potassium channel KAT3-like [Anoplophora glabripennis]|uniref:potassium channel KAT3-like n=1 Tax=Anoplophora glabripennis TaxID=217634 RepID=UPI0008741298|nr:potassium channel KAT3-like [Anoplophora glabripennis]